MAHDQACRRLVCAVLVRALRDARRGDLGALLWVHGPHSLAWAEAVGFERWPPTPDQIRAAKLRGLRRH